MRTSMRLTMWTMWTFQSWTTKSLIKSVEDKEEMNKAVELAASKKPKLTC
jgi:hypothetical protein